MTVKVLFFGVLAEVTGANCRYYSDARSIDDLRIMIMDDFPEIVHYSFRISVNNEITDDGRQLIDRDEIALLPPFAGG